VAIAACGASPGHAPDPTAPSVAASPTPRATITPDEALAAARAFTGTPLAGATVEPPSPDAPRPIYTVDDGTVTMFVDASDGSVGGWTKGDFEPGAGADRPREAAIAAAMTFLHDHAIVPPAVTPTAEVVDHGAFREWSVRWQARAGAALAPDMIHVGVDAASAAVFSMVRVRRPYVAPPVARVGRDDAIDLAKGAAGMPAATVVAADLAIDFATDGTQILIWRVQLDAGADAYGAAWVDVDAITGAARLTGQG
jgi:hypothetical protein